MSGASATYGTLAHPASVAAGRLGAPCTPPFEVTAMSTHIRTSFPYETTLVQGGRRDGAPDGRPL
ncbi:hypothetical protein [Streptomyces sp. NBC_00078]|uniref:hypothetical protein n=1 Tax=unclassified Streptomyces TaxID=2593676 RepID=UPI002251E8CE|nr:hypothetical protein [Streptomyces sp. NBC_00078]MCX5422936.1 hypothetical protein [Streptomyces sp. NBC_00078]